MKELYAATATADAFAAYGEIVNIYACDKPDEPICYFPDRMILDMAGNQVIAGVCHVAPQAAVIAEVESHNATDEGWILLNGGAVSAFALPCKDPNKAEFKAFSFPAGAYVRIRKGVWHFAPLPNGRTRLAVYCTLPPNTPETDCTVVRLDEALEIHFC